MKKPDVSRIMNIMEFINPDLQKRRLIKESGHHYGAEAEFQIEAPDGEPIMFTVEGDVLYDDFGIGSYEYWGARYTDTQYGYETQGFGLKEGTYDEQYKQFIEQWMNDHAEEINEKLEQNAAETAEHDEDYENEYDPDDRLDEEQRPKKIRITESQLKRILNVIKDE